jgi:hypothetical protein
MRRQVSYNKQASEDDKDHQTSNKYSKSTYRWRPRRRPLPRAGIGASKTSSSTCALTFVITPRTPHEFGNDPTARSLTQGINKSDGNLPRQSWPPKREMHLPESRSSTSPPAPDGDGRQSPDNSREKK